MKIRLGTSLFSPAYTLVTVADFDNGDWNVLEVELYYDAQYTRCMSDDNPIGKFPGAAQVAIYTALNEYGRPAVSHLNEFGEAIPNRVSIETRPSDKVMSEILTAVHL